MPPTDPRAGEVFLRAVLEADLPVFYEHQRDPEANRQAAFPARGRAAFMEHWGKIVADEAVVTRTILRGEKVAGNVVCFEQSGRRLVGYWLGREFWGRGIATAALLEFLTEVTERPLHAYVARHNLGSIRVLEKCGFTLSAERSEAVPGAGGAAGAAAAAGDERVDELLYELVS